MRYLLGLTLTRSAYTCKNKESYSPVGSKGGKLPSPTRLNSGGSGRNKTFSSLSYHHPSLSRDSHCSAEIHVLQSGGVELAASCFPEHRLQLLAGMDIPRGARAARRTPPLAAHSCSGVRTLPARQSRQQGSQELPAPHPLLFCRNIVPVFLFRDLWDLWGQLPAPPTNPNGV